MTRVRESLLFQINQLSCFSHSYAQDYLCSLNFHSLALSLGYIPSIDVSETLRCLEVTVGNG